MKKIYLILSIFVILLNARTYQLQVIPNYWQMIGINGFHKNTDSQIGFISNGTYATIKDTADSDDNTTWDRNSTDSINGESNSGDVTKSTLGIKILDDAYPYISSIQINYKYKTKDDTKYKDKHHQVF